MMRVMPAIEQETIFYPESLSESVLLEVLTELRAAAFLELAKRVGTHRFVGRVTEITNASNHIVKVLIEYKVEDT